MPHSRLVAAACALALPLAGGGCAGGVQQFIARTRNHQADLALAHQNLADAALGYRLALRVEPGDAHARSGLAAVQLRIAAKDYVGSDFEGALAALAVAAKYEPESVRLAGLRAEVEQARVREAIVVSNYPTYRETGLALRRSYSGLKTQSNAIVAALQRFAYTYDAAELDRAIRGSSQLQTDVARLTSRSKGYRQLVEAGSPERDSGAPLAPAASLLPLP